MAIVNIFVWCLQTDPRKASTEDYPFFGGDVVSHLMQITSVRDLEEELKRQSKRRNEVVRETN